jgi:hypothetical protein
VMMVPADGKFFFASDVLKSPAQMMKQQEESDDPPSRLRPGVPSGAQ